MPFDRKRANELAREIITARAYATLQDEESQGLYRQALNTALFEIVKGGHDPDELSTRLQYLMDSMALMAASALWLAASEGEELADQERLREVLEMIAGELADYQDPGL